MYDPLDPEPVDRCICYDISFAELKAIAERDGLGLHRKFLGIW